MIATHDVKKIGRLLKPHGYKGEISLLFDKPAFADVDAVFYFFDIEGLLVPFFVEDIRFSNDILARVKFEDVDDEVKAARFAQLPISLPKELLGENTGEAESFLHDFIGFEILDKNKKRIGEIVNLDDATLNLLFVVKNDKDELLIPATEDFIVQIDTERKILHMYLPEGLV